MSSKLVFAAAAVVLAVPALGFGGMSVEDLVVTNDGKQVFADNFNDGSISDWTSIRDAAVFCAGEKMTNCFLHINRQTKTVACAYHALAVRNVGVIELSAWIWLPKPSEQKSGTFIYFYLSSGEQTKGGQHPDAHAGPELRKGESGYRVGIGQQYGSIEKASQTSKTVLIKPETWTLFTIRLDRRTATALVDGKPACSVSVDYNDFASLQRVSVWGWFGDCAE